VKADVGLEPVCPLEVEVEHLERRNGGAETLDVRFVIRDEGRSDIEAVAAVVLLDEAGYLRPPLRLPARAGILFALQGSEPLEALALGGSGGFPAGTFFSLGLRCRFPGEALTLSFGGGGLLARTFFGLGFRNSLLAGALLGLSLCRGLARETLTFRFSRSLPGEALALSFGGGCLLAGTLLRLGFRGSFAGKALTLSFSRSLLAGALLGLSLCRSLARETLTFRFSRSLPGEALALSFGGSRSGLLAGTFFRLGLCSSLTRKTLAFRFGCRSSSLLAHTFFGLGFRGSLLAGTFFRLGLRGSFPGEPLALSFSRSLTGETLAFRFGGSRSSLLAGTFFSLGLRGSFPREALTLSFSRSLPG
jgi:hypothetical protein